MPRVRWLTFALLLPLLAGCSFIVGTPDATPEETSATPLPTLSRAATPTRAATAAATRPAAVAPTRAAAPTKAPAQQPADPPPNSSDGKTLMVANTDGEGVFIRAEPVTGERLRAYSEGTELTVTGAAQAGDGRQWLPVRGPDGVEGWIPEEYLAEPGSVPIIVPTPAPVETVAEATVEVVPTVAEVVPVPTVAVEPTVRPIASPTVAQQPTAAPATATEEEEPGEQTEESAPCLEGQVKANNDEGVYYRPGQDGYEDLQVQVTCFDSEDDAREAGYVRARN